MSQESRPATDLGLCLVTGSSGYLGSHLLAELSRRGHRVRGFDQNESDKLPEGAEFFRGDIRRFADVRAAVDGVDTVFHTAAMLVFLGFARRGLRQQVHDVNVGGARNVIRASLEAGVRRIVHTSSNNVTLGDDPVIDGDETCPYARNAHDLYTETKVIAEEEMLAANGQGELLTGAVRPGGIYGPGEKLMLPTLVNQLRSGRFRATVGDGSAMSDNTFIDNLVDGEIAAAEHLFPGSTACGQAYFITDGAPINYFEFFRPVVESLGYEFPTFKSPVWPVAALAWVWEFLHYAVRIPRPLISRHELRKITVSHYNRIDKARRDLGWTPPVSAREAMDRCLPYCRDLHERSGGG